MNKQRVLEAVNIGLSGYEFTKRHRQDLLAVLKREKIAGKRISAFTLTFILILLAIIAFVIVLVKNIG